MASVYGTVNFGGLRAGINFMASGPFAGVGGAGVAAVAADRFVAVGNIPVLLAGPPAGSTSINTAFFGEPVGGAGQGGRGGGSSGIGDGEIFRRSIYEVTSAEVERISDPEKVEWAIRLADESDRFAYEVVELAGKAANFDAFLRVMDEALIKAEKLTELKVSSLTAPFKLILTRFASSTFFAIGTARTCELAKRRHEQGEKEDVVRELFFRIAELRRLITVPKTGIKLPTTMARQESGVQFIEWVASGSEFVSYGDGKLVYKVTGSAERKLYGKIASTPPESIWPPDPVSDPVVDAYIRFLKWSVDVRNAGGNVIIEIKI